MPNEWGLTNWPPVDAPPWPDMTFSTLRTLVDGLFTLGWTYDAPTPAERNKWFRDARDGDEHKVNGIIVVSDTGVRFPFAVCTDFSHLELLVLWPPYSAGTLSG